MSLVTTLILLNILMVAVIASLFRGHAPHGGKKKRFSVLSMEQAFDPDHAIIWDTQVPALQLIASAGREGLSLEELRGFYARSACRYPELYDGSSFESWLEFLKETQLISVGLYRVLLMPEGQQFLWHRVTAEASGRPR